MAREEQILSTSNSGVTKSRNGKQKRVPQRGLGVAQLEKIRVEEQRKKEALQIRVMNSASSLVHPCPDLSSSSNSLYRSTHSVPDQIMKQDTSLQSVNNGNWPALWSGEYANLDVEKKQRLGDVGYGFGPHSNFPYELNPLTLPSLSIPRIPSSLVDASASSIIEPPSNQIINGNKCTFQWPVENKIGMKRPFPFGHFPSPGQSSFLNSVLDELPSCSFLLDGHSNSDSLSEQNRDEEMLNGDFLTLAPPDAASRLSSSKQKRPLMVKGSVSENKCQENAKNRRSNLVVSQQPFNFFPVESRFYQSDGDGDGESMDLNLKL